MAMLKGLAIVPALCYVATMKIMIGLFVILLLAVLFPPLLVLLLYGLAALAALLLIGGLIGAVQGIWTGLRGN